MRDICINIDEAGDDIEFGYSNGTIDDPVLMAADAFDNDKRYSINLNDQYANHRDHR